ncbi:MAG: hypothetical protein KDE27_09525, partial [Planctomycetes bacterium]|nr:hypothetical protein [Planctomycetota bacterium]
LTEDGTYDVVGGVQGETSAVAVAVLAAARPHVEVTLRTAPFVAIEGIVRDDRGTPLGDVLVGARQDRDRDPVSRERIDLQGGYGGIRTAADGTFRFEAAAGFPYELRAQAIPGNRELWATGPTVVAPASGVVVVVRDVDRQGFTIAGRVLRAADGSPVARARIARITHHGSGASHGPVGTAVDGEFEVGPLAVGARYSFEFEAPELAPVVVGPFEAGLRREEVTVRLPEFGRVRCRVQRPDGTVAVGVFVSLNFEPYDPFGPAWQGDTDADGVIEFERVPPRAYRVHAAAKAAIGGEADVETVVASGQATDVTVVLSK